MNSGAAGRDPGGVFVREVSQPHHHRLRRRPVGTRPIHGGRGRADGVTMRVLEAHPQPGGAAGGADCADDQHRYGVIAQRWRRGRTPSPPPAAAAHLPLSGDALARVQQSAFVSTRQLFNVGTGGAPGAASGVLAVCENPLAMLRMALSPFQGALPVQTRSVVYPPAREKTTHQRT